MRIFKPTIAALAILISSVPAIAQEAFRFDPGHSEVVFSWNHLGLSEQSGKFVGFGGEVTLDPDAVENSSVVVKIAASSLQTGNPEFDGHLRSDEFFDVEVHPDISICVHQCDPHRPRDSDGHRRSDNQRHHAQRCAECRVELSRGSPDKRTQGSRVPCVDNRAEK